MKNQAPKRLARVIGNIPHRLALAGGWIDQPFVSRHNPRPSGSMVVVSIKPDFRAMERSGLASGTRAVANALWKGRLPRRNAETLVQELYEAENRGKEDPSGSQDMIGLIYPGISRLDYDQRVHGGIFPARIESTTQERILRWLERLLYILPIAPRPEGYNPLGKQNLAPAWIGRLGRSGEDCYDAICSMNATKLGAALNECMICWEKILPETVHHPALKMDLKRLLKAYQSDYPGAMYSGCGGGYLFVISPEPVPGAFQVTIRRAA